MKIRAGELRHRIVIQHYVRAENEVGEEIKSWQPFTSVWASFLDSSDVKDQTKAEKSASSIVHEIVIRHRGDIDATMRVVYRDKSYNIDHVTNPREQNVETHLICTLIEGGPYNE